MAPKADFVFDWRFLIATTFLSVVFFELHEVAHILTGYIQCGGFGPRDFNVWSLAENCKATLPGYMGPAFTIGTGYVAAFLLFSKRASLRAFAIALFWAGAPFSRLLQSLYFGGGDEIFGLYNMMNLSAVENGWAKAQLVGRISLFLATWPLLALLWWRLAERRSALWVLAILIVGEVMALLTSFLLHDPLIASGLFSSPGPMGGPWIITVNLIGMLILSAVTLRWLFRVPETIE